jgi:four helix bundle protein
MNPNPKGAYPVKFDAYTVALEMIRSLRSILPKIRAKDPNLAKQIQSAASSVPLNLNEGRRRRGKDRLYHYSVAAGSADEVRAGLDVAEAWDYVTATDITHALGCLDRILAMTWRMTH